MVTDATFVSVVLVVRALGPLLRLFLLLLALPLLLLLLFSLAVATVTADTEAGGTGGACMDDAVCAYLDETGCGFGNFVDPNRVLDTLGC